MKKNKNGIQKQRLLFQGTREHFSNPRIKVRHIQRLLHAFLERQSLTRRWTTRSFHLNILQSWFVLCYISRQNPFNAATVRNLEPWRRRRHCCDWCSQLRFCRRVAWCCVGCSSQCIVLYSVTTVVTQCCWYLIRWVSRKIINKEQVIDTCYNVER